FRQTFITLITKKGKDKNILTFIWNGKKTWLHFNKLQRPIDRGFGTYYCAFCAVDTFVDVLCPEKHMKKKTNKIRRQMMSDRFLRLYFGQYVPPRGVTILIYNR
uniref:Uncharacterized protein n=1 Tax=Sander lucioperca TaxID=283035 RepID=A0A8C9YZW4_SANLU